MEKYIQTLTEQIRCKKARDMVGEEIKTHILDQAEAYKIQGMAEEEALKTAVRDMGDPVEAGIALDRVHRPQTAFGMIGLMSIIALLCILIHVSIGLENPTLGTDYIKIQIAGTVIGFLAMFLVCRLDYSVIAEHAKGIAVFLFLFFLLNRLLGAEINGTHRWIAVPLYGLRTVSLVPFTFLYIPVYGALLYQYHGTGYKGILKSFLWMLPPVLSALWMSSLSMVLLLTGITIVLLGIAVGMDWFKIKHKKVFLGIYTLSVLALPSLLLFLLSISGHLSGYQRAKIHAFISKDTGSFSYISNLLAKYMGNSRLIGHSGAEFEGVLPSFNADYIVTFLAADYGILSIVLIGLLLLLLVISIFGISFRQKNQLGRIMGCGCGTVLLMLAVTNYMENMGLLPITSTHLPFFSAGGTDMLISYILMGIVLSIYRHKSILPGGFPNSFREKRMTG